MTDYISREAALDCFACDLGKKDYPVSYQGFMTEAAFRINDLPAADARPVITCGECKHSDTFSPDCTEATFPLKCLSIRYGGVYPNWFCEHGEKREES